MRNIQLLAVVLAALICTLGCGGTDYTNYAEGQKIPTSLTIEQIENAKAHIDDIRPGITRGEMWDQLLPLIGGIKLQTIDDSSPARNTTQSYAMGHGYILRVFFEPHDDSIYRRAEIVKR